MLQVGILWADTLLLGKLESSRAAAVYAASTRWLVIGQFAGLAITTAFAPQISALLSLQDKARARKLFQTATAWFILLAWPAYLTVMAFRPTPRPAVRPGVRTGCGRAAHRRRRLPGGQRRGPVDVVLLMGGKSSLSLANNFIALVANIGLNFILIPHLGLRGAAIAWAVALFITNIFPLIQVWSTIGIHPFGRQWMLAAGVVVITVEIPLVAVRAVFGSSIPAFAGAVTFAGLLYLAALWLFFERLEVASLIAGARRRTRGPPEPR